MSIVSALRSQQGSIRELAMLPQQEILKLAQSGQLSGSLVPVVLNEKALMIKQSAQMQAAAQPKPPTVVEQAMATNAQEEAMPQADVGIATAPVREDMYQEKNYAGGGIVAFSDGGNVKHYAGEGPSFVQSASTPFGRGYESFAQNVGRAFYTSPEERLRRNLKNELSIQSGFLGNFMPQSDEARANAKVLYDQIDTMSVDQLLALDAEMKQNKGAPARLATASTIAQPTSGIQTMGDLQRADRMAMGNPPATTPPYIPKGMEEPQAPEQQAAPSMGIKNILQKSSEMANALYERTAPPVPGIKEAGLQVSDILKESGYDTGLFEKQQEELRKEKESLSEDRKTATSMRILEAGLGILSGESPYAFVNIGKGATPAVQGLAKDIKELKTAERAYNKAVMDLDSKKNDFALSKAGMTQKVIDKAQDRVDREDERIDRLKGTLANTMLSGEIQKEISKMTGSSSTDFSRKWQLYTDSLKPGEKPSPEGFMKVWGKPDSATELQQLRLSLDMMKEGFSPAEIQRGVQSLFGGTGAPQPPQAAIDALKNNPSLRAEFDAKYGPRSAARYLGQ